MEIDSHLRNHGIAVVGMACRYPQANTPAEFWRRLRSGTDCIHRLSREEVIAAGEDPHIADDPKYVFARGLLDGMDQFDAAFFGFLPRDAALMDPQERLFMTCAWESLEDAGIDPDTFGGSIGIFGGAGQNTYALNVLQPALQGQSTSTFFRNKTWTEKDHLAPRTAYRLNLNGPALTIQTACSTSLVAAHTACQSLLAYECDAALAGGSSVFAPQDIGYLYEDGMILSPDGHCRPFDAQAQGTVPANGVGMVVLKRLEDALDNGDNIYSVIRGTAINNDGSDKIGYTAPSISGQARAVALAQSLADVDPSTIRYIEAHGTATALGDPIEIEALTQAFRSGTDARQFCGIGSVKSNIGHTDAAAGVAGLIKASLVLKHREIPPSLFYDTPNPEIDFAETPFYVVDSLQPMPSDGAPRRAAVSSFGLGGTNAHMVLEEAPVRERAATKQQWHVLPFSAASREQVLRHADRLASHFDAGEAMVNTGDSAAKMADTATTLAKRRAFAARSVVVARTAEEAAHHLRDADPTVRPVHTVADTPRSPVFLFPGGGAQYPGMGRDLYDAEPTYRTTIDRCVRHLRENENLDIRPVLFPEKTGGRLTDPATALPALVTVELALAELWMSWGVTPDACLGHSVGEYVAACVAGVMTPEEMLSVVALRGRLFESLSGGAMLSVALSPGDLARYLSPELDVAVENGPEQTVVAGPADEISALEATLTADGYEPVRLHIDVAAHSQQVEPVLDVFEEYLSGLDLQRPRVPFVSNVTGTWIQPDEAMSPAYWARHMRHTVRFDAGLETLLTDTPRLLIEAGPGRTLSSLARMHEQFGSEQAALTSMRHPADDVADDAYALARLGEAWCVGANIDLTSRYDGESRRTISLPTYPFRQDRHWFEANRSPIEASVSPAPSTSGRTPTRSSHEAPQPAVSNADNRFTRLQHAVRETLMQVSGLAEDQLPADASFVSLGFDSLFLTQVSQALRKTFGVRISFRDLLEKTTTIEAVASLLDETLPADAFPAPESPSETRAGDVTEDRYTDNVSSGDIHSTDELDAAVSTATTPRGASDSRDQDYGPGASGSAMERIVQQQLDVMQQQLDLLRGTSSGASVGSSPTSTPKRSPSGTPSTSASASSSRETGPSPKAGMERREMEEVKMFPGVETTQTDALTDEQQAYLTELTERYTTATSASRRQVGDERAVSADPRMISGFKTLWKEMVYPIVSRGSKGARLVDVDGNEYVDFTMGYGSILYGHAPDFITEALREQLDRGFELGPMTDGIGEAARRLCTLTGHDRAFFVSTGSEAMMAAIRIARTVTGRSKIAVFNGAYHGNFDEVNVRPNFAGNGVVPGYPGIPASASDEIILVEYGDPAAFDTLREHAGELAAVLVEPVQSRRPNLQPQVFLQELRTWTAEHNIALVFDEMITGFRCHPGGAQAYFGVKADLAAYGKILGGGLPIGVVAGASQFMDSIDGGTWTYGDDSVPAADLTYYEGTHRRHPLAMTAANAVLKQIEHDGPALQVRLNERTEALSNRLRRLFVELGVDFKVVRFASLFRIQTPPGDPLAELFFYHMRLKGMYVWDQRNHFVSPAHSNADLDRFVRAAHESLEEMIAAGVLEAEPADEPALSISGDGMLDVPVASAKKELPLTDGQREIWVATQMEERANSVYNESIALNLTGAVNLQALESAAQFIIDRHEALRTTFAADGSAQTVHPSVKLPFHVERVSWEDVDARLQEQHATPFDLEHGPLVRCALFQVENAPDGRSDSGEMSVLVWTVHHLVADGWSLGIILDELATAYTSLDTGTVPDLEPATPLHVLVASQSEPMDADTKTFWTEQFSGFDDVLDLPLDAPRQPEKTYRGGEVVRSLSASDTSALSKAAQSMGMTLFSTLLAGYGAFLSRITGQDDLVVGIPSALQYGLDGGEALVGHGVNVLPMRLQIDPETSFADWSKTVQSKVLDAREYGQVTFGSLLNLLSVRRTAGRVPLVETILNLDLEQDLPAFGDLAVSSRNVPKSQATFDLAFDMLIAEGELSIFARYNADILSRETVGAWLESFEAWMKNVSAAPSTQLADVPAVSSDQFHQLTETWSQGWADEPLPTDLLDEILTRQATLRPDGAAIESHGTTWTYAELESVVNAMGRALQASGVTLGDRVALYAERTIHTVAAALAIIRIGGVYVPLDPSYPTERLAYIVSDSGARVLAHATNVPPDLSQRVESIVDLSAISPATSESAAPVVETRSLLDPAYIIYTSGSTGTPKGVQVPHRGLANLARFQSRMLELQPRDRILQLAPFGFDASISEIAMSICAGSTLIIGQRGERVAVEVISGQINETHTTVATLPPSLLGALKPDDLPDLRAVVVAGEACPQDVADRWGDAVMLFNGYGPTEATVCATMGRLRPGESVTIGRPIDHVHAYILDESGHPVPPGAFGELCIGGPGVALGYVGRPQETEARFVADPFIESDDARMYRTGDRCRWRLDGTIDFGGRMDEQMAIHGYRVEPGEIEGVLRAVDVVQDAAIRLHETENGAMLAAYLVPDREALDRHVETDLLRDEHNHQETFYAEAIREHNTTEDTNRNARSTEADVFVNPTTSLVDIYEQTIDVAESEEWMRQNLDRIRALSPDRMLEIGCGTSEVLFNIAPSCSRYEATDLSASAVEYTRALVEQPDSGLDHVTVQQRPADNFEGWEKDAFDLVYFGSVVQYFPNAAYLRDVLTKAAHVTEPGGTIYLSDVNSHTFVDVLYTEGMLKKADDADTAEEVRERIERRLRRRNWLFLEPAYFVGLRDAIPELESIQIRLRRAATQNQPAKYHYDVFLTMGAGVETSVESSEGMWQAWQTLTDEADSFASETDRLLSVLDADPDVFAVRGVPNARVLPALRAFHALDDATGPIRPLKAMLNASVGVDPESVWMAGEERGYTVDIAWSDDGGREGRFDVLFRKNDANGQPVAAAHSFPIETTTTVDRALANDPAGDRDAMLIDMARARVNGVLPTYMRPARYVVLDVLPRTPNGKTDRLALPPLESTSAVNRDAEYQAPRNETERILVDVAIEMLHVDQVGIHDDLFELGADSMLVFQICARVQAMGIPLRPQEFFQSKTIAGLVEGLARREVATAREEKDREEALREKIKNMSPAEVREMLAKKKASHPPSGVHDR